MYHKKFHHMKQLRVISPNCEPIEEDKYDLQKRSELTNIIKIFFNFAYYLGASPFRFAREAKEKGCFRKNTWRPQLVICAFLHILAIFRLVAECRELLPTETSPLLKNPKAYLDMFLGISNLVFKLVTMKRLWFHGNKYLKVLNAILDRKYLPIRSKWITKPSFLYAFFGFFALKVVACVVAGYSFVDPISSWTPSWWLRRLIEQARFVFSFSHVPSKTEAKALSQISCLDYFLAFLILSTHYVRFVCGEFFDLFALAFTWTLWTVANSFSLDIKDELRSDSNDDNDDGDEYYYQLEKSYGKIFETRHECETSAAWKKIYKKFQAIQELSELINISIGSQVTWNLATDLLYYSVYLQKIFMSEDIFEGWHKLVYFCEACLKLYMAADICQQMKSAKSWLSRKQNVKYAPTDHADIVLHEDIAPDIGIRGGNKFTITFEFVAKYASLIITFFIICVEEKTKNEVE